MSHWFDIKNSEEVLSPALLFYPNKIQNNIDQMIKIAGAANRLRPHVKTYKCHEIVAMQISSGIKKFKCATLVEAKMLSMCGVKDVLVAYPLIGPNRKKFVQLANQFPGTQFSVLIDHESQIESWKSVNEMIIHVFIDLNVGMHRTGILPEKAIELYEKLENDHFKFRGWHAYDGHIHDSNLQEREKTVELAFKGVDELSSQFDLKDIELICGGSITFPIHTQYPERQLSPGTTLLWDRGYSAHFPDLEFEVAAMLLTRVVSKPGENLLCLDLGHKSVASEMREPSVFFPQVSDAIITIQAEEHLVIETSHAAKWNIGDELYGIPWHICPTVALHEQAGIVMDNKVKEYWQIEARKRSYQL